LVLIAGISSIARNRCIFSLGSLMYWSISKLYVSEWMFSMAIWKP